MRIMHDTLKQLILSSVTEIVASDDDPDELRLDDAPALIGRDAVLDSLSLVSVIVDVEQRVLHQLGLTVTLADDRAMSQRNSPFRTIGTLTDYLEVLVMEQSTNGHA